MKRKLLLIIYIITLISVFIMCTFTYHLYKINNIKPEEKTINREIQYFISYDSKNINLTNITPGLEKEYKFSIENNSSDTIGNYKIILKVNDTFSNISDNDFTYSIESSSESTDKSNEMFNMSNEVIPMSTKEIGQGIITPNNKHLYTITINVKNDKNKINYWKNKSFQGEIIVETIG